MNKTMSINHHPSEALLFDYAAGSLEPARAIVVAAHVHACASCQASVAAAEAVGGALLEDLSGAPMSPDALDRALARLEQPGSGNDAPPPRTRAPHPHDWIRVPAEVVEAAARKRWVAPGVWVAPIDTGTPGGPLSYLLRVGQGMRMPQHTHAGSELTLVLKGAFLDGGDRYGPGDVSEVDDEVEHSPAIVAGEECVCLVACDNRLIVRDWLGRLVQSYAGI